MNNRIAWIAALAFAAFGSVAEAQTITAVYTTYSDTGVPTKLDITGTAFCTTTPCGTKAPVVRLAGNIMAISGSSPTGIGVPLTGQPDGDYLLSVTPSGKTAITYAFTLKSKTGGATGPQGPMGPQGPVGPAGLPGLSGQQGPAGPKGDTGTAGADGAQGVQGPVGATGPQGPMGLQGLKGDKGDTGPSGTSAPGSAIGAILYWNGNSWIEVAVPADKNDVTLRMCRGVPVWANACPPPTVAGYKFGDTGPAGGKIFYVAPDSSFALEASPANQEASPWGQGWGCVGTLIGNTSTEIGTGASNTAAILAKGCAGPNDAASLADAYTFGGYSDWYLPSKSEVDQLLANRDLVGNWINCFYYSSSESSNSQSPTFPFGIWIYSTYDFYRTAQPNECVGVRAIRTVR